MPLLPESKEVINEILKVQQILRKTAPKHALAEPDRKAAGESLERAEKLIVQMRKEVSGE